MACTGYCSSDCFDVCSATWTTTCQRYCTSIGAKTNGYGVPDVPTGAVPSASVFTKIQNAITAMYSRFGLSRTNKTVTAGQPVTADDWNTKIRGDLYALTWAQGTSPTTLNQRIDLGTVTGGSTEISTKKPNSAILAMNQKYCTTVCYPYCYSYCTTDCNSVCSGDCVCIDVCSCVSDCQCIDFCASYQCDVY